MVAVEDLDPPEEAKIKTEPKGVPHGAPPKEELAGRASEWGETSADKLPDDHEETYGEAADHAYAYNRAKAHFRRFSNGMHTIMAVRIFNRPRKSENMAAPSADYLMSVPELAHKTMDAPSPYEVGSGIYVNPGAAASSAESATERSARSSASVASTADDVRVIMLQQEVQRSTQSCTATRSSSRCATSCTSTPRATRRCCPAARRFISTTERT